MTIEDWICIILFVWIISPIQDILAVNKILKKHKEKSDAKEIH